MQNLALGCEAKDTLPDHLCNGDVLCPSGKSRGKPVIVFQYLEVDETHWGSHYR